MAPHSGGLPRVLLLAIAAGSTWNPANASDVAAFAAKAALSVIKEADVIEARVAKLEDSEVARAGTALEAYTSIHDDLGSFFEVALSATRHAAAAQAAAPQAVKATQSELAELASLDKQISALLSLQHKEPLFFWHGPKRMVLSKLRSLLVADGSLRRNLEALAARSPDAAGAVGEKRALQVVGGGGDAGDKHGGATSHRAVPEFGMTLGEEECGEGYSAWRCSFQDLSEVDKIHLMVSKASPKALRHIGQLLATVRPFLSLVVEPLVLEQGPDGLKSYVEQTFKYLGVKSVGMLWLPLDAFKKKMWEKLQPVLSQLQSKDAVRGIGIVTDESSAKALTKIFEKEPKPVAWLATHDLPRPMKSEALGIAKSFGIAVVALPRRRGILPAAVPYARAVGGNDPADQVATQHRWSFQRGLSVVVRPEAMEEVHLGSVQQRLKNPLGPGEMRLLSLAAEASRPVTADEDGLEGAGLDWALQQGRRAAAEAKPGKRKQDAVPSVRDATLETLEEQAKRYKGNNHVIYQEDFFDNATWDAITAEVKRLWKSTEIEANCNLDGVNRLGGYVLDPSHQESSLYRLIYGNEKFRRWVSAINAEGEMWPSDFPIEVREYGTRSKGMGCHSDLQMYAVANLDLEFAITVNNPSKCEVTYYDAQNTIHKVHTRGNSVMMVRAGGAVHCVSSTVGGSRTILKFIYVGDYRKARAFWSYTDNVCDDSNPNRRVLVERREAEGEHALEL